MLYGLAPEALASCSASPPSDPAQRCVYPDTFTGIWNVSLTYASDTVITLPHFLQVMQSLQIMDVALTSWPEGFTWKIALVCLVMSSQHLLASNPELHIAPQEMAEWHLKTCLKNH